MMSIPSIFIPSVVTDALSENRRRAQLRAILITAGIVVLFLMFKKGKG